MSTPETILREREPIRPLKRVEFERLAIEGYFDDERVELLFGMVVPMAAPDPAHCESTRILGELVRTQLGNRARVHTQSPLAASEISEPLPDVLVVPNADYWREHPTRALLVIEVSRSSLRNDRGPKAVLYGQAEVDEYWIVNQVESVVEVYRDRHEGAWRSKSTHGRGETIAMVAFPDVTIAVSEILPPLPDPSSL